MKNKKRTKTKNSKTPLKSAISGEFWSEWRDSNARPLAPKASALPLGYTRINYYVIAVVVKHVVVRPIFGEMQGKRRNKNPASMRLSGLGTSAARRSAYTLPNHPRYQLRYTRMLNCTFADAIIPQITSAQKTRPGETHHNTAPPQVAILFSGIVGTAFRARKGAKHETNL